MYVHMLVDFYVNVTCCILRDYLSEQSHLMQLCSASHIVLVFLDSCQIIKIKKREQMKRIANSDNVI